MLRVGRATGAWTSTDRFRHAIERINPVSYLADGYYGRWLGGIETMLVEAGVVSQAEITQRAQAAGAPASARIAARPSKNPDVVPPPSAVRTARRESDQRARFEIGDVVTTATTVSGGHTRLPAYARGKTGTVTVHHHAWVFPDTNAHGLGEQPQHLYTVAFTGAALWGATAEAGINVYLDLFEPYLAKAGS